MMPHPIRGRLSLHPIRVSVEWVANFLPRGTELAK